MKTVVITGASTGIGRACAERMDQLGWRVLAGVRKDADAESLRASGSDRLEPVMLDVTNDQHIEAVRAQLAKDGRGLDGLINNGGIAIGGPTEGLPMDQWRRQFDVNFFGQIALTSALLPQLREAGGGIVNVSSMGGKVSQPFMAPYCASKHALEAWSDALRLEVAPFGVSVSIMEPGNISTEIWGKGAGYVQDVRKYLNEEQLELYGGMIKSFERAISKRAQGTGAHPDLCADVAEHALTASRPKTRYLVGRDAKVGVTARRFLPDRVMDFAILRELKLRER
jgi:NAD(P)-dependent dehydrogenase (short-subunit alcohol dehydrogenase family)